MIHCPKCGVIVHLDEQSKDISNSLNTFKWGATPEGFLRCWGCGLPRPELWWDTIKLDMETEIVLPSEEPKKEDAVQEELAGEREAPWGD